MGSDLWPILIAVCLNNLPSVKLARDYFINDLRALLFDSAVSIVSEGSSVMRHNSALADEAFAGKWRPGQYLVSYETICG